MKNLPKFALLPWLTLLLGLPAMVCMLLLHSFGVDDRGLFIPGHWTSTVVWVLTALMAAALILYLRGLGGKAKYGRMFPDSPPAALGTLAAGLGVLWSAWTELSAGTTAFDTFSGCLGLAAGASLLWLAWCRFRNQRASFLLWTLVCVFMMLRLMFSYRIWSAQPELLRYCFPLLASVCLTLAFYYRTAFAINLGSRRMYLFFSQMGGFFSLLALANGFDVFYLGMLLWTLTDLCSQRPFKTAPKEEAQ